MSEALVSSEFVSPTDQAINHSTHNMFDTKHSGYTTKAQANVSFMGMDGEKSSLHPHIFVDKNSKWLGSIKTK